jgi:hypothetical protein
MFCFAPGPRPVRSIFLCAKRQMGRLESNAKPLAHGITPAAAAGRLGRPKILQPHLSGRRPWHKVGAGGSPVGKALPRKFEAAKAPMPCPVPSTSSKDAEERLLEGEDPPPPPPAAAQAAANGLAAPRSPAATPTPPQKAAPAAKPSRGRKAGGAEGC